MKHHPRAVAIFHLLPGWNNQDIVHLEFMKIFLPVVDPVNILRLPFFYRAGSDLSVLTKIIQPFSDRSEDARGILVLIKVEIKVGCPVVLPGRKWDINKHLLQLIL